MATMIDDESLLYALRINITLCGGKILSYSVSIDSWNSRNEQRLSTK
jgi:hypothetical protein